MQSVRPLHDENQQSPPETAEIAPLVDCGQPKFEPGYWRGMRQAAMLVPLRFARMEVRVSTLQRYDAIKLAVCERPDTELDWVIDPDIARHPVLKRLVDMSFVILTKMGMPVTGGAVAEKRAAGDQSEWLIALPAISEQNTSPLAALQFSCRLLNELDRGASIHQDAVRSSIEGLVKQFRYLAPAGVNTLHFLKAAHEMDIPWRHVAKNVFQFGWGSRSRWLDSSFTDETSTISANLARDKVACAEVLRDAGFPVPKHQLVTSAEHAVKVAKDFGYPVVVKPSDLDGGRGVMAGLRNADAVQKAFSDAAKLSKRILVEQFVNGSDYRIRICRGDVLGVMFRRPASVVGDGKLSVQELINRTNAERRVKQAYVDPAIEQGAVTIQIDGEVEEWLSSQDLRLDSVLPEGARVRLRGAANWSLGGTTRDVASEAHSDNLRLAIDTAAALRLDLAGVDLLLPDIGRSWKETGGAICEVNAQPQFSTTPTFKEVLARLVKGKGRIPVVVILGSGSLTALEQGLTRILTGHDINVRWCATSETCRQAVLDKSLDVLIWTPALWPAANESTPFDRADLLVMMQSPDEAVPALPIKAMQRWTLGRDAEHDPTTVDRVARWVLDAVYKAVPT